MEKKFARPDWKRISRFEQTKSPLFLPDIPQNLHSIAMPPLPPLPHPDNLHLRAAEGWLELGDPSESLAELEKIAPVHQSSPFVLMVRHAIQARNQQWELARQSASRVRDQYPDIAWGHFHLAFSLHELKQTQAAYDILKPVLTRFPKNQLMRYNLACYACQLGKHAEAMQWLKQAIKLPGEIHHLKQQALADPDLEALWPQIRAL